MEVCIENSFDIRRFYILYVQASLDPFYKVSQDKMGQDFWTDSMFFDTFNDLIVFA